MVHFTTTVANIGNVNGTNSTTVEATYSAGCSPVAASYNLPPVLVGVPRVDSSLACTCIGPGRQTVTIRANPSQRQWETSFDNNNRTITFICQTLVQLTCPDFV
jgi:hypothetical protein